MALSSSARELALLSLLTIALLLPFLSKPLHIDDPMYVWTAKHIVEHPVDFYGFEVNWRGTKESMATVNENPPGVSYWLALVGALLGWGEPALHAGMLVPAVLVVVGVWLLALRLGAPPLLAGLSLLAMPGFLVSSTTLMADILATTLWVWAILAWVVGLKERRTRWLGASALLVGLCILTKFVGLALIPLLLVYTLLKERQLDRRTLLLLVPLGIALAYRTRMVSHYGVDPFAAIGSYAREQRGLGRASAIELPWLGLAFLGGTCLPVLLLAGWIFGRRAWVLSGTFMLLVAGTFALVRTFAGYPLRSELGLRWDLIGHLAVFMGCGALVLALVIRHLSRRWTPEAMLLGFWVVGIFLFASFVNWSTNVRALVPATPAVGILLATEAQWPRGGRVLGGRWVLLAMLGVGALAGLLVAQGDQAYARSARDAALVLIRDHQQAGPHLWYQGAWGFQYYMDLEGASKINWDLVEVSPGDQMVLPSSNCFLIELPPEVSDRVADHRLAVHALASTVTAGAGFYSHLVGPVPYRFGFPPDEVYSVFRLRFSVEYR